MGCLEEYNMSAEELPQHTRVAFLSIVDEPLNYDMARFGGPWPTGGVVMVKLLYPPSYSTWRNQQNWHTG